MVYRKRKSCKSHGERILKELFETHNITYIKEKTFDNCRNSKNNLLRFDFYLPNYNILIEYQGKHHYEPINKYAKAKRVHQTTVIHDSIKSEFCSKYNFKLIQIPYWEQSNIESIIMYILQT